MKPSELSILLSKTIPAQHPVLVTGAPGTGKSDIIAQASSTAGADLIISHPAVADPTDAKGLPWPKAGAEEATFLPFGELARAIKASKPTIWFLDDLGQASPAVQASFMQLLLARRVNGHTLPSHVVFIAATNRRIDRAGVSGILEPVKSRFCTIVELTPDLDDWCGWAFQHEIPSTLIAFIRFRAELLNAFTPTADLTNSPCPRTWAHLAKIESLSLPANVEQGAFAGAVGAGAATEYLAFRKMSQNLINIDTILQDPKKAAIPSKPAELYAVAVGLAARADGKNLGRVAIYIERLVEASYGEFATLTLRDAVKRTPAIARTNEFIKLACGPLGKLISGAL